MIRTDKRMADFRRTEDQEKPYENVGGKPMAAQKEKIQEKLLATTDYVSMQMHYETDPALIGGLVIRIGDRVVDSSIRTRLEDMKRNLMKIQL